MLDQSFSKESLRRILDYENRKGNFLEGKFFPTVVKAINDVKIQISQVNNLKRSLTPYEFEEQKSQLYLKVIPSLKEEKERLLLEELGNVSKLITNDDFVVKLTTKNINGKKVYLTDTTAATFFALKQLQYNIRKLYKVKQSNRYSILSQIKQLISNSFPKIIVRTDIKEFYENIPQEQIINTITEDNLLTQLSKDIIVGVLKEYKKMSLSQRGVPRGIGISAYLSELYMRKLDNKIMSIPDIIYYGRYVDDIIAIFSPMPNTNIDYKDALVKILEAGYLTHNECKTQVIDSRKSKNFKFDYLGYKINCQGSNVQFAMSTNRMGKYKDRMIKMLECYKNQSKKDEKKARKLLVKRMRFLTTNTKLTGNKSHVMTGIFYTNSLLSGSADLKALDNFKNSLVDKYGLKENVKKRLIPMSFEEGFEKRMHTVFSIYDLKEIMKIWQL